MNRRKLGNSGLEVAPLALGGNVFGWTVNEDKAFPILDAFVSAGFNLIDTADIYPRWVPGNQGGESEEDYRELVEAQRETKRSHRRY